MATHEARSQAVNLDAIGISSGFETPDADPNNDAAEQTLARTLSPGWTFNLLGGASADYGTADEDATFYGSNPLPAPFQGRQIGYFNLEAYSAGEVVSDSIGTLTAGQTYTLNVAVGARNRTQNDWSNVRYAVGLRTLSGTNLGTFATVDLDPGSAATVISDLAYTLNVDAEAAAFVGSEARIVIRGIDLGTGVINPTTLATIPSFTQANFDNIRLNGTLGAPNRPILTINQATGAISLSKTGTTNMPITGYSLTSAVSALNSTAWLSIADHYDKASGPTPGDGSVDSNDAWTVLSAAGSKTNLAEGEANIGGNGGTLSNASINLGNAWRKSPYQDVQATITFADGTVAPLDVVYSGNAIVSGDLNTDGLLNAADWTLFKTNWRSSLTGLTKVDSYYLGDLNGDLKHDLADFVAFRTNYNAGNGAGAFEAMAQVPEPAAAALFIIAGIVGVTRIRRRNQHEGILTMNCSSLARFAAIATLAAALLSAGSARAQSVVAHWSFDTPTLTTSGGNITGISDQTANHNMSVGAGVGSGGGCPCNSLAIPSTNSIAGKVGQGLTLSGNSTFAAGGGMFLSYPSLDELSTVLSAPGAPSYTVSYWLNTTTVNAQQYTILSDWGNRANNPGRFTYAFGLTFTGTTPRLRTQTRFNTTGAGNGTDIFARDDTKAGINDGSWHMLTWTFDTNSGQLTSYLDAVQVAQSTSTAANFNMIRDSNTNPVGTLGLKGDTAAFINGAYSIDEAWVVNGALTQAGVTQLFNNNTVSPTTLTLRVDPATGQAQLRNNTPGAIDLNSYRITSAAGALAPSTWTPISGQSISGFPAGNGTGNGWETPPSSANPADYNGSGTVDAADFVKWRKDNINGSAGYDAFRNNFGLSGTGPGTANDLVEWYLQGTSTFAAGASINLGQAFTISGAHDLSFTYGTATGVVSGTIEYGSLGAGSSVSAVPEPATGLMLLSSVAAFCCSRRRQALRLNVPVVRFGLFVGLLAALCGLQRSASAAYTVDRLYHFGEDPLENATAGIEIGSGATNVDPGTTLDSQGPSGAFVDLAVNGATGKPKYLDVSVASPDIASPRPGASSGNLGALFDGVDDYLNGLRFNQPNNAPGTHLYTTPGPLNYDGILTRGFQLWVYPKSAGSAVAQHVVMDSRQHGLQTTATGTWALVYGNTTVNSNTAINFNQWSHLEVAMPGTLPNREVLYVNGVAIAARQANYTTNTDPVGGENAYALTVAAATGNTVPTVGTTNRFNGVVDELQMFVWGSTFDASTNTVTNLGQFNYATDNQYAASHLTGVPGDINQSGSLTQADIDTFVANWLSEKLVNNVRVGDMTTILKGDLNFDGITDLSDLALLHSAIAGSGSGASFDVTALNSLGVPEPAAISLAVICISGLGACRRRRANMRKTS